VLVPREHGAYGQLVFPLLSALLIGHPAAGSWLLSGAAAGAFLAHESLLVLLGQRGVRAAREQHDAAMRSLALFGGFSLVTGIVSLAVLPRPALLALVLPAALLVLVLLAMVTHVERTTAGEVVVALALASVSVPVALAGGVDPADAQTVFLVFASVFVAGTLGVRAMIGRVTKAGGPSRLMAALLTLCLVALLAWLAHHRRVEPSAPYAATPVALVALWLSVWPPSPRQLRRVGWTLVGATLATTVILVETLA